MSLLKLKLSQTQSLALRLLHDPTVVELLYGGGAGGARASSFASGWFWSAGITQVSGSASVARS